VNPVDGMRLWTESGLQHLSGARGEPAPLHRDYPTRIVQLITPVNRALHVQAQEPIDASVLTERAALMGLRRRGARSANRCCQLYRTRDGFVAINLARPEDREMIPALLGRSVTGNVIDALRSGVKTRSSAVLLERGISLGLPIASLGESAELPMMRNIVCGMRRAAGERPLLVNLASLWAGPLCAHLLGRLGARVIKVESIRRPDGSREGCRPFFDRLHQGQEMVALDFDHPADMAQLRALLLRADIIIEGSRPRALARRGIDAREIIAARPGRIWASITAYGRSGGGAARVGFGDDAAIAAGLALRDHSGFPVFVGDAIADPLAGLAATVHILSARAAGGGVLLDLPLAGAAAFVASAPLLPALPPAPDGRVAPLAVPLKFSPRQVSPARAAGADTARVLAEAS
jgi:hypothetical protein